MNNLSLHTRSNIYVFFIPSTNKKDIRLQDIINPFTLSKIILEILENQQKFWLELIQFTLQSFIQDYALVR